LDAIPDEGSWNNPPVVGRTFSDIQDAGFKSIRLPSTWLKLYVVYADHRVTWASKIGPAPAYKIDEKWLTRVGIVVDQITTRGLYTIINMHHDSGDWLDFSNPANNITAIEEKFAAVWKQVSMFVKLDSIRASERGSWKYQSGWRFDESIQQAVY
jgi:endoglucanase